MNFYKLSKKNFSKFVYRQSFEIFGHKLTLENMNTRKQLAVKLYKLYYRFLDINKIFKNTKQFKLVKFLLFSEIFFYSTKFILNLIDNEYFFINNGYQKNLSCVNYNYHENKENIPKKDILKNNILNYFEEKNKLMRKNNKELYNTLIFDSDSNFYRSNLIDLAANLIFISYIGKYIYIINPRSLKFIVMSATICNVTCLLANEKIKSFVTKKTEIKNFDVFRNTSFLSKILISYSFFAFFEKTLSNKKIGFDIFKVNRKPIFLLLNLFFLAKFTNFISLFTCETLK